MPASPPSTSRRFRRSLAAFRALRARQRRVELALERRYPKLYDARHAATGVGRALWPIIGPLLAALILLPIVALLAALVALLGLQAPSIDLPSIDLPSVDLPEIPFPDITAPGWLRAIGEAIGAVLSALASASKYIFVAGVIALGVGRTVQTRRKRAAAEQIGRTELLRRLTVTLRSAEEGARARGAATLGDDHDPDDEEDEEE